MQHKVLRKLLSHSEMQCSASHRLLLSMLLLLPVVVIFCIDISLRRRTYAHGHTHTHTLITHTRFQQLKVRVQTNITVKTKNYAAQSIWKYHQLTRSRFFFSLGPSSFSSIPSLFVPAFTHSLGASVFIIGHNHIFILCISNVYHVVWVCTRSMNNLATIFFWRADGDGENEKKTTLTCWRAVKSRLSERASEEDTHTWSKRGRESSATNKQTNKRATEILVMHNGFALSASLLPLICYFCCGCCSICFLLQNVLCDVMLNFFYYSIGCTAIHWNFQITKHRVAHTHTCNRIEIVHRCLRASYVCSVYRECYTRIIARTIRIHIIRLNRDSEFDFCARTEAIYV